MNLMLLLMPEAVIPQVAVIVIMLAGLCFMLQMRGIGRTLLITAGMLLLVLPMLLMLIDPILNLLFVLVQSAYDALPWWVILMVIPIAVLLCVQIVVGLLFGRRAADHTVGTLAADGIRGVLRFCIMAPVRIISALLRRRPR